MLITLLTISLMMGLTGGPHCLMMCGPTCTLLTRRQVQNTRGPSYAFFLMGRSMGYGATGALAAISMQTLGWLSTQSPLFRPLWNMTHALALVLGLFLLVFADQPLWIGGVAKRFWQKIDRFMSRYAVFQKSWAVLAIGVLWSLIPCSLLYSALMVAALSASALQGALVMFTFSLGGAVFMAFGSELWVKLSNKEGSFRAKHPLKGVSSVDFFPPGALKGDADPSFVPKTPAMAQWGVRLAGLALATNSAWILYHDLVLNLAPWCVVNP